MAPLPVAPPGWPGISRALAGIVVLSFGGPAAQGHPVFTQDRRSARLVLSCPPLRIPVHGLLPTRRRRWLPPWRRLSKPIAVAATVSGLIWFGVAATRQAPLWSSRWKSLERSIARRATVELEDGFRSGFSNWAGAANWSRHPDGYTRPGALAVYRPSQAHADYRIEFLAQVESGAVSWVMRAKDARNYYAMKLVMVRGGRTPEFSLVRYTVLEGQRSTPVETPIRTPIDHRLPYPIMAEVKGQQLAVAVAGYPVEAWSDETHATGGAGFFAEPGARVRIYWIKFWSNDDVIGRICKTLAGAGAPYPTGQ